MILKRIANSVFLPNVSSVRYKNPSHHWPVDKALNYFDEFYKDIFNKRWPYIRKALLSKQKYVAVINNFGDDKETSSELELKGAINVATLMRLEKKYIMEEIEQNKRNSALDKIFKLDEKMELQNQEERKDETVNKLAHPSMETSLKEAQIDSRRLIDVRSGSSTECLAEFIPATKIKGKEDFIYESDPLKELDSRAAFNVNIEREYDINFPDHLKIYCFEENNTSIFDHPKKSSTGVLNYYLMDGGSVLPVLALDLKPGNRFLDMCAGPGGKSLLAIQTLYYLDCVISNDVSKSRLDRVHKVYNEFLFDFKEKWLNTGRISLSLRDARLISDEKFDRILVDVPCTTDRRSLFENDNNIFKSSRLKERLKLPELQKDILFNALKLLTKGGIAVYSTCSLNPTQNHGVIHAVLKQIWEETNIKIVVKDLSVALLPFRRIYEFADKGLLKYGHLVLPSKGQNYGPTYFCKLQRVN